MEKRKRIEQALLFAIIAFGALLRVSFIGQHRFHGDEALYAYWAQDLAEKYLFFLRRPYLLYKPPYYLFTAEITYWLLPVKEIFAQIPNILASTASIWIVYRMGLLASGAVSAGLLCAVLFALMPGNILFGATAFLDPLMVFFGLLFLLKIMEKKYLQSGIYFGLALGTKQFAVFYLPFAAAMLINDVVKHEKANYTEHAKKWIAGFGIAFMPALLWGVLNSLKMKKDPLYFLNVWFGSGDRPEVFKVSVDALAGRMNEWLYYYNLLFVFTVLSLIVVGFIIAGLFSGKQGRGFRLSVFFSVVFVFLLTSLSGMPIYDRYIITFAPLVAILAGVSIHSLTGKDSDRKTVILVSFVALIMIVLPVHMGLFANKIKNTEGQLFGAQYIRNDGIEHVINYVTAKDGKVTVYFHPDFSWFNDYYLYQGKAGHNWLNMGWFTSAADIENNVEKRTDEEHYLLFYADKDESKNFQRFKLGKELIIYNREAKENLVLYSVSR